MTALTHDVVIAGAGVTGLACAAALAQAGLTVACAEQLMFGGLVVNINELEPTPDPAQASGVDLASALMDRAIDQGVKYVGAAVRSVARQGDLLAIATEDGNLLARAVVVATGARLRALDVPGAAQFEHRGLSHCADCDAPMHADRDVVVVGGGDSAMQEALVLAQFCRSVRLIHRDPALRGRAQLLQAIDEQPLVRCSQGEVIAIEGDEAVSGVRVRTAPGGAIEHIACSGVFVYIGLQPNSEFLGPDVARDGGGHVITDDARCAWVPGLLAAGAVRAGCGGTLADALADAAAAAATLAARLRPAPR